jgi:hypothetical protein
VGGVVVLILAFGRSDLSRPFWSSSSVLDVLLGAGVTPPLCCPWFPENRGAKQLRHTSLRSISKEQIFTFLFPAFFSKFPSVQSSTL